MIHLPVFTFPGSEIKRSMVQKFWGKYSGSLVSIERNAFQPRFQDFTFGEFSG
jgi:hypothetical protein